VDSDLVAIEQMAATCRNFNYQIGILSEGSAVLEALEAETPDLVVLGVELPDENGFVLFKKIKSTKKLKKIPIILISNDKDEKGFKKHRKLKDPANAYLYKPIDPDDLIDQIEQLIGLPPPPSSKEKMVEIDQLRAVEQNLHQARKELKDKEGQIRMLRESYENVSQKLERGNIDLRSLQAEREKDEKRMFNLGRDHQEEIAQLKLNGDALSSKLENDLEKLKKQNEELDLQLEQLMGEEAEFKKHLEGIKRHSQLAEEENVKREKGLKERIKELLAHVDEERQFKKEVEDKLRTLSLDQEEEIGKINQDFKAMEKEKIKMEQRVIKAYKKIKMDQLRDEKMEKALEIALKLLKSAS